MATNDFIHDLVDKLHEDNMEFMVIAVQKGKDECQAMAKYNIKTEQGANTILYTLEHVFADDENVASLVDPKYFELPEDEDEESE